MLKCDGCGDYYDGLGDGGSISIDDDTGSFIEESALDEGWVKVGEKHYCPCCHIAKEATKHIKLQIK